MHTDRFDTLLRSLAGGSSRRGLAAWLPRTVAAILALTSANDGATATSGKCHPACGPCERCKKGTCHKTRDGKKRCKNGKCKPKASGTTCASGGVCQGTTCVCPGGTEACGGACVTTCAANRTRDPTTCGCCLVNGAVCVEGPTNGCCSGGCVDFPVEAKCYGKSVGQPCAFAAQCVTEKCSGGFCST